MWPANHAEHLCSYCTDEWTWLCLVLPAATWPEAGPCSLQTGCQHNTATRTCGPRLSPPHSSRLLYLPGGCRALRRIHCFTWYALTNRSALHTVWLHTSWLLSFCGVMYLSVTPHSVCGWQIIPLLTMKANTKSKEEAAAAADRPIVGVWVCDDSALYGFMLRGHMTTPRVSWPSRCHSHKKENNS